MSYDIKHFYEQAFSSDYCGKMPKWLAKEAKKEFAIIESMIIDHRIQGNVIDFGCGDGRVIKWLDYLSKNGWAKFDHFFGIDIIDKPKNYPSYASYIQDDSITPLYNIYKSKETIVLDTKGIDLVVSVGVSVHLAVLQLNMILNNILLNIKPGAYIIWQLNHKRTLKGKWLNWTSGIEYKYHNFEKRIATVNNVNHNYVGDKYEFKILDKQSTNISDIYLLRKYEKI